MIDAALALFYSLTMSKALTFIALVLLAVTLGFILIVLWFHFMAEEVLSGFDDDCSTDNPER